RPRAGPRSVRRGPRACRSGAAGPCRRLGSQAERKGAFPTGQASRTIAMMAPHNGLQCLVVDDEPRLRRVLVRLLEGDGFVCREAGSGVEALEALESQPVPLMLSDVRMPLMDGVALLREVTKRWPDTAVVMVTAVADVDSAVNCLQLGALDYVAKPFHLDEVRARVAQALDKRRLLLENKNYHRQLEERVEVQARRLEEMFIEGVEMMADAQEAKDPYLQGHSLRVAEYALSAGRSLGLDATQLGTIFLAGVCTTSGKSASGKKSCTNPASCRMRNTGTSWSTRWSAPGCWRGCSGKSRWRSPLCGPITSGSTARVSRTDSRGTRSPSRCAWCRSRIRSTP